MEQNIKERLILFIQHIGISINRFEMSANLGSAYISHIKKSIGSEQIQKIIKAFPNLNKDRLLTEEGTMLKGEGSDDAVDRGTIADNDYYIQKIEVLKKELDELKKQLAAERNKLLDQNKKLIDIIEKLT